jgi:hypothetical protein
VTIPTTGAVNERGTAARHGIQAEFKGAATNIRLGAYYRGGARVPAGAKPTIVTAGAQKFSNYRGAKLSVGILAAVPGEWMYHFDTTRVPGRYQYSLRFTPARTPVVHLLGPTRTSVSPTALLTAGFVTQGNALNMVGNALYGVKYKAVTAAYLAATGATRAAMLRAATWETKPFQPGDKVLIEVVMSTNPAAAAWQSFTLDLYASSRTPPSHPHPSGIIYGVIIDPTPEELRLEAWIKSLIYKSYNGKVQTIPKAAGAVRTDLAGGTYMVKWPGFMRYTYTGS